MRLCTDCAMSTYFFCVFWTKIIFLFDLLHLCHRYSCASYAWRYRIFPHFISLHFASRKLKAPPEHSEQIFISPPSHFHRTHPGTSLAVRAHFTYSTRPGVLLKGFINRIASSAALDAPAGIKRNRKLHRTVKQMRHFRYACVISVIYAEYATHNTCKTNA